MLTVHAVQPHTRLGRVASSSPLAPRVPLALLVLLLGCKPKPDGEPTTSPVTESTCNGADALDRIWTAPRHHELQAALATQPGEWPAQTLSTIDARLADARERWRDTYARACEQQNVKAQRCLDLEAWQLDAIVATLLEDPARAVLLWAEIDAVLRDPAACADTREPSFDAPPLTPEVGRELMHMRLLLNLGSRAPLDEAVRALQLVELVADTPAYALQLHAIQAIVAFRAGRIDEAAAGLATATTLGEQLGPRARTSLAHVRALVAFGRGDIEGGLLALDEGLAAAREQSDPWLLFSSLRNVGNVRIELRDHAGAVPLLTEAVALSTRLAGSENPHTADVQVSLASAVLALGQIEAAHDLLTQARDSFVNTLGPDHPQTLAAVTSIAKLLVSAGRPFEANHAFLDLLEIYGELYGPKDARTAMIKLELADTLMSMDAHDSARTFYLEALTPLVQALGADHRDVIRCAVHLGIAELALGNLEAAETHCRRSSDLVKALPTDDPLRAEAGRCIDQLDQLAKAGKRKRGR
jgi:tetratricopeptide (TPR) repeat protein